MERAQLGSFQLTRRQNGDLLLLANGPTAYKPLLDRAFPALRFSRWFPARYGRYDWGTYVNGADAEAETALRDLCQLFHDAVLLPDDDLDESFALAFHKVPTEAGGLARSRLAQLVYAAKPYDRANHPGDRAKAKELAALFAAFIGRHPTYRRAELVAAVPPSNKDKPFDLPAVLAEEVAALTGHPSATAAVHKTRDTRPMKECPTMADKMANLAGAFAADAAAFAGRRVLLLDDIYQTGFSVREVGRALRTAGAVQVLGLAATKTFRDLPPAALAADDDSGASDEIPF